MHLPSIALVVLTAVLPFASAAPNALLAKLQKLYSEGNPWLLNNIAVFAAAPGTHTASNITFTFEDTNKGIELVTDCERVVLPGKGSLNDGQNYYPCLNNTVAFMYNKGNFAVQRTYLVLGHRRSTM